MKLCVFSDIHGNGPSFKEAFPRMLSERAHRYLFLGDLCGYYYDQLEILALLQQIPNLTAILGNHDKIFLNIAGGDDALGEDYREKYGKSIELLLCQDHSDLIRWLKSLPDHHVDEANEFSCYHGSPIHPFDEYVYPDSNFDFVTGNSEKFFFLGHTHYGMVVRKGGKMIINPGSLGQPRDGGWPCYVVFDTETKRAEFKNVTYDRKRLLQAVRKKQGQTLLAESDRKNQWIRRC